MLELILSAAYPSFYPRPKVTVDEAEVFMRKTGKATGCDDLTANLWGSKIWCGAEWLGMLFNQVVAKHERSRVPRKVRQLPIGRKRAMLRTAEVAVRYVCFCTV